MDFSRKAGPSAQSVAARLRELSREVAFPDLADLADLPIDQWLESAR